MRILKLTPENLRVFGRYLTEEEERRLGNGQLFALGAMAGMLPCAVLLFTAQMGEANLEKIFVEERFRRRGVAAGLLEQVGKSFPGLYRMECSYQENRYPAFDRCLKGRKDFFFADGSSPVYIVGKEEAGCLKLPGGNGKGSRFFDMEEYAVRRFMKIRMRKNEEEINRLLASHAWVEEACLCHGDVAQTDACLLTERTAEGGIRLFYAFSGRDGASAFLACLREILEMVREGTFPAYEIVCRTDRSRKLFGKLLSDREPDGYLVTAYRYM